MGGLVLEIGLIPEALFAGQQDREVRMSDSVDVLSIGPEHVLKVGAAPEDRGGKPKPWDPRRGRSTETETFSERSSSATSSLRSSTATRSLDVTLEGSTRHLCCEIGTLGHELRNILSGSFLGGHGEDVFHVDLRRRDWLSVDADGSIRQSG
ncbi:hypothetical protein DFQ28_001428, partial [Apophysomyces sp. BC1034]